MPRRCASGRGGRSSTADLRDKPAVTRDGSAITLLMNAGLLVDLPHLAESGAEGIGLFRTELQFMIAATMPKLARAAGRSIATVLDAAGGRPVTFRTLDIGGDKVLPYMRTRRGGEPGAWAGGRSGSALDRPGLLRTQIRALLQAAAGRELRVMLPMVTELGEIRRARDAHRARARPSAPARPCRCRRELKIGAMVEVPALLFQLDELAKAVDFVSVGSNDLFQFMMASDRGNTRVAEPVRPAVAPVPARARARSPSCRRPPHCR